jgi:hypothetical protein
MTAKLSDIATSIGAHLRQFSQTPSIAEKSWIDGNGKERKLTLFWSPRCFRAGSRVKIRYVNYQYESSMTKAEALQYLEWLNAGNVGRHYDCLRAAQ